MAAHRQGRIFLPPKELCPLCPTKGELLTAHHRFANQKVIGPPPIWSGQKQMPEPLRESAK
jgi:hypothetical protein